MSASARTLATLATCGAALLVLLVYAPAFQAPFLVPKFGVLEVTASLGFVAFALERVSTGGPRWSRPVSMGAWLVLATSAISWAAAVGRAPGTPYAVAALARWGCLFGLACGVSVIDDTEDARQHLLEAITIASAAVAAIGLLQHLELLPLRIPVISTPGSTFGNRNFAAEAMAMALPLGLAAVGGARRLDLRAAMWGSLALEIVFLAVTRARGAWVGAACGLGAALWLSRIRVSRASLAIALSVVVLAGVAAALPGRYNPRDAGDSKRYSGVVEVLEEGFDVRSTAVKTRLGLWRRTAAMVRDQPLFGVGPGNWPVVFPRYAEPGARREAVLSATLAPRQAHDDLLERTAETGIPGFLALVALAAGAAIAVRRRLRVGDANGPVTAGAAGGALVALAVLSLAGFPLEMPGTLALAGLSLGLVAADTQAPRRREDAAMKRVVDYATLACGLALIGCAAVRADRSVRSSFWLGAAERAMHRDLGVAGAAEALASLKRAAEASPLEYRVNLRMAQMLLREHRSIESARAAQQALSREPYAPNAWAALAAAELDAGEHVAARRDAGEALALLQDYPFALKVRASAAEQDGDIAAAQADLLHLSVLAAETTNDDTARAARTLVQRP